MYENMYMNVQGMVYAHIQEVQGRYRKYKVDTGSIRWIQEVQGGYRKYNVDTGSTRWIQGA